MSSRSFGLYRTFIISISMIIATCVVMSLNSCKQRPAEVSSAEGMTEDTTVIDTLPADFVEFFDKFHGDSAYQMAHIVFPLEGLPPSNNLSDTIPGQRFFYQREDWVIHNRFTDPGGNFEHWYEVIDERLIEHWVQLKGTEMVIRRRFAKLDDGWYLIYYSGMGPVHRLR